MTGFELRISGVGSDSSTNWATSTAHCPTPSCSKGDFTLTNFDALQLLLKLVQVGYDTFSLSLYRSKFEVTSSLLHQIVYHFDFKTFCRYSLLLLLPVWPDWAIYWTLGNFSKPLATINLPKSLTFLGNFYKGVNIFNFPSEIIFGQLL